MDYETPGPDLICMLVAVDKFDPAPACHYGWVFHWGIAAAAVVVVVDLVVVNASYHLLNCVCSCIDCTTLRLLQLWCVISLNGSLSP